MSFTQDKREGAFSPADSASFLDNKSTALVAPKSTKGISGFVFDIPDTDELSLQSDITDHYTEDNSFLNDHIVRKPVMVTLAGFIGELVYTPNEIDRAIQELTGRLSVVSGYLPDYTTGGQQIINGAAQRAVSAASQINQAISKTQNLVSVFTGESQEETKQEKAFNTLYALWQSQEVMTVLTPWKFLESMVIERISFMQTGESEQISDITVTLKEIRTATVKTTDYENDIDPPRVDVQKAETEEQGGIRGEEEELASWFYQGFINEN
jgi:hypothetical protein